MGSGSAKASVEGYDLSVSLVTKVAFKPTRRFDTTSEYRYADEVPLGFRGPLILCFFCRSVAW